MSLAFLRNCNPVWSIPHSVAFGKVCRTCRIGKPLSAFGKNQPSADGHLNSCKVCCGKARKEALARG